MDRVCWPEKAMLTTPQQRVDGESPPITRRMAWSGRCENLSPGGAIRAASVGARHTRFWMVPVDEQDAEDHRRVRRRVPVLVLLEGRNLYAWVDQDLGGVRRFRPAVTR